MIIIVLIAEYIGTDLSKEQKNHSSCDSGNVDMTHSAYFMAGLTVVITLVFIVFFRPTYKRLEAEHKHLNDRLVNDNNE